MIPDAGIVLSALVVFAGACVQGVSGIGFALFAAPLVALSNPGLVPGPMLVLGATVSLLAAVREHQHIDYSAASIALLGRVPGSIAAGFVVGWLAPASFGAVFGLLILAALGASFAKRPIRPGRAALGVAGFASGFMGTITSVGTPPIGIVLQGWRPHRLRPTVGAFLFAGSLVSIAVLVIAGRFQWQDMGASCAMLPALALGFWVSGRINLRVAPAAIGHAVRLTCLFAALLLLARAF